MGAAVSLLLALIGRCSLRLEMQMKGSLLSVLSGKNVKKPGIYISTGTSLRWKGRLSQNSLIYFLCIEKIKTALSNTAGYPTTGY